MPEAARLMERRGVERLPVVDEADRLIGIANGRGEARSQVPEIIHATWRLDRVVCVVNGLVFHRDDCVGTSPGCATCHQGRDPD
ncbi:CBS domain-containing protein, partial [Streptomyces massasporeus]